MPMCEPKDSQNETNTVERTKSIEARICRPRAERHGHEWPVSQFAKDIQAFYSRLEIRERMNYMNNEPVYSIAICNLDALPTDQPLPSTDITSNLLAAKPEDLIEFLKNELSICDEATKRFQAIADGEEAEKSRLAGVYRKKIEAMKKAIDPDRLSKKAQGRGPISVARVEEQCENALSRGEIISPYRTDLAGEAGPEYEAVARAQDAEGDIVR